MSHIIPIVRNSFSLLSLVLVFFSTEIMANEGTVAQPTITGEKDLSAGISAGVLPVPKDYGQEACDTSQDIGTKINCGTIELSDLPILVVYWIDYLTWIAGSIAVVFIMIGGVQYMVGSLSDTKDAGQSTLQYAVVGLIVTFVSWLLVNMLQSFLTA